MLHRSRGKTSAIGVLQNMSGVLMDRTLGRESRTYSCFYTGSDTDLLDELGQVTSFHCASPSPAI